MSFLYCLMLIYTHTIYDKKERQVYTLNPQTSLKLTEKEVKQIFFIYRFCAHSLAVLRKKIVY